ncbi:hypothetical protein ACIHCX_19820 [Streptomyces sp. NPDC052043]|uniref:hypothetical protein n=1 Tax=Streptomyces sp. NPDC052043 TaxID=3365684 RepID=UPI0037D75CF3
MPRRSKALSGMLIAGALLTTSLGVAGVAAGSGPPAPGSAAAASFAAGHSGHAMAASTASSPEDPDGDGYIPADPPVTGVTPSTENPPHRHFRQAFGQGARSFRAGGNGRSRVAGQGKPNRRQGDSVSRK